VNVPPGVPGVDGAYVATAELILDGTAHHVDPGAFRAGAPADARPGKAAASLRPTAGRISRHVTWVPRQMDGKAARH
jgi:hypothetical protein